MKIFVFGSTGMLGRYVTKYLSQSFDVVEITRKMCNARYITPERLDALLINNKVQQGDIVINCIGLIKQKPGNDLEFILTNSIFPLHLEIVCNNLNLRFIHISTDCVFNGFKGGYFEDSITDANDIYGRSKALGEPKTATIIRTSIIGEGGGLLQWVLEQKEQLGGYINHEWNGITCLQFAKICEKIIKENLFWQGVKHVYSEKVSKFALCLLIKEIYKLDLWVNASEALTKCDRSLKSKRTDIELNIPDLIEQITEQKNFI